VFHDILSDVRTSVRQLARTPGFAAGAVAVLALGIGLNAAVFGVFHALVFAGRPFAEPSQIVQLYSRHSKEPDSYRPFAYAAYEVANGRQDVFTGVAAHTLDMVGVRESGVGDPRRTFAAFVSANYFDVLGVPVVRGRPFTAEEARAGSQMPVAIVSDAFWRRSNREPSLIGQTVLVNERPVTIIGVTPPGFTGTMMVFGPELFLPLGLHDLFASDLDRALDRGTRSLADPASMVLFLVGRLSPGLTVETASTRLAPTSAAMAEALPAQYRDRELSIAPLPRFGTSTSPMDESVLSLLAIVFLGLTSAVLLIVCLNLASVVVARGQARRREFAIRLALGGGRHRIVRQLMVEALLLGVAGAVGGVLLGMPAIDLFLTTLLSRLPVSLAVDAATTTSTLAGGVGFGVLAAVAFALGPALRHSREGGLTDLKQQVGDDAPTRRRWLKHPLVTAQVALSLALLVAAGLFVRFAQQGTAIEVGAADDTVIVDVDAALAGLDEAQAMPRYAAIESRLGTLPGVEAAALGVTVPFGPVHLGYDVRRAGTRVAPGDRPTTPEAGKAFSATWNAIGATYPRALGLRLTRGRTFTDVEAQRPGAPPVAIIDEVLAAQLWPDGDALGQSIHIGDDAAGGGGGAPAKAVEIVGIVSPLRDRMFVTVPEGAVYVPFAQGFRSGAHLHVRPRPGAEAGLLDVVRATLRADASDLPVFGATTFGTHLRMSLEFWGLRMLASVATSVGLFAAVIALVGVYGAMAYAVTRGARDIGVRLAIGASPATVRRHVLGEAAKVGAIGVGVGSVLGLGVGQALSAVFVDLAGVDPVVSASTAALLLAACAVAAWVPALRASRLDPATVLRAD
jgi:predicted permease